jgi:hypothetical protein
MNTCERRRRPFKYYVIKWSKCSTFFKIQFWSDNELLKWKATKVITSLLTVGFFISLTSKLITCFIEAFTFGVKSKWVEYLLSGSEDKYWNVGPWSWGALNMGYVDKKTSKNVRETSFKVRHCFFCQGGHCFSFGIRWRFSQVALRL